MAVGLRPNPALSLVKHLKTELEEMIMKSQELRTNNPRSLRKLIAVLTLILIAALASISWVRQGKAVQEIRKESLKVEGPRPMANAIEVLESRCRCPITYEDPRYVNSSEIDDVTAQVRRDLANYKTGEAPKVLIPKGGAISIEYNDSPASSELERTLMILRQLLDAHHANGNAGLFRFEIDGQLIHVVPTAIKNQAGQMAPQESFLDALITVPVQERRGLVTLQAICAAISQATKTKVIVGSVPMNLLAQHIGREGGKNQKARDLLLSLLEGSKRDAGLSWQLLYDPGMKIYALNIHQVG